MTLLVRRVFVRMGVLVTVAMLVIVGMVVVMRRPVGAAVVVAV